MKNTKEKLKHSKNIMISLFPWKNKSIRDDLRKIKFISELVLHKWIKSFSSVPKNPRFDRLNVGCGELIREGWTNIDLYPAKGAYYVDVNNGLPFNDSTFNHIQCEHFLEHLEQENGIFFISECRRVLRTGGTIRFIVPDAEKYFAAYITGDAEFFEELKNLGGAQRPFSTACEVVNQMFRMGGDHLFAWDYETLAKYMIEAGFRNICKSEKNDIDKELDIDGDDSWRVTESLYINAEKVCE